MIERFGSLNNNYQKVKKVLGKEYLEKSQKDDLKIEEFLDANYKIGSFCYGEEVNRLLWERRTDLIYYLYKDYLDHLNLDKFQEINFSKIGLILVRPEVYYYRDQYKKFLEKRNLEVLFEKKISIDIRQYLLLYYDSFILADTIYDFPSRTLNYIDNDSYLYVVTSRGIDNVANYLFSIKGKQGKFEIGTLRGDVSYRLLKDNVHDGSFIKEAIIPLDPIGAGRMLTRNLIPHDGSHNISDIPLLFYAGQSVHVPNFEEIKRDIATLCNEKEIQYVLKKERDYNE